MLLQLIHPLYNRVGGSKGVSASLQEDADVRGRIPVLLRLEFIIPAAHFDPGYITQMDGAKRRVAPQHDVSELLRIHELVAAGYRVEELLVLGVGAVPVRPTPYCWFWAEIAFSISDVVTRSFAIRSGSTQIRMADSTLP